MNKHAVYAFLCALLSVCGLALGDDWPTFNHDNHRSGLTGERLQLPLKQAWVFKAPHRPAPAWPPPAKHDFWHRHHNLRATVTYDRVFHVVGAGEMLYFGSSADDKVYALDALTGRPRWTFFTEGPVRLAPAVVGNRLYVGSDDGCVYCLRAEDGSLLWKYSASEQPRMVPGNGAMISLRPVRAGLVADGRAVYCTAGLFPNQGTFLFALNAEDGSVIWKRKVGISPQGYILASDERLYVPTGRTAPAIFARADGGSRGELPSAGGTYVLLTDDVLVTGPGRGPKEIKASDAKTRDAIATFGGLRMLINGTTAYMQSETKVSAFNRGRYLELSREKNGLNQRRKKIAEQLKKLAKESPEAKQLQENVRSLDTRLAELDRLLKDCYLWTAPCEYPCSMIMAGNVLFAGGENKIAALDSANGSVIWTAPVAGRAFGLSIVNGGLLVSTDEGRIHCFRNAVKGAAEVITTYTDTSPYPRDELTQLYAEAAKYIAEQSPVTKGYCLVLDSGRGRLAYELARITDLKIIGVEEDAGKVAAARKALDKAGLYGRVVIHQGSSGRLPYTKYFANLIVSDRALRTGELPISPEELFGLVRPAGGVVALGVPAPKGNKSQLEDWGQTAIPGWRVRKTGNILWGLAKRRSLEGAGEWTHIHAEPGNSACSKDTLVKGPMAIQWFGRPGPEQMIDRHHRNVPPLFKDGRLFVPGDCIVFAVDAYNGTIQWQVEIPNSRRLGVFLDSGSMAVDENLLYVVAEDKCHGFDVQTGTRRLTHKMPQLIEDGPRQWGYIAYTGDVILGTGRRKGASYTETSYDADNALWHRNMKLVVSDYVFAVNKTTGEPLWKYKDGLVLNTTIAIGGPGPRGPRMYFIETDSPAALADKLGRMPAKTLFDGGEQYLVGLDIQTGRLAFKEKIDASNFGEPVYINYAKGILLLSGSDLVGKSIRYYYDAFDSRSGRVLWRASHDTSLATDGGHGEYNRHPTIIDNTVYAWPYAYNLRTGKKIQGWKFDRRGHGCGGVSASAQCLFWRGANPWMYDLGPGGGPARLTSVTRPGCWINIIPAGGLVLIPEASSGCTCAFPLQSSTAFIPMQALNEVRKPTGLTNHN
ncbi:MAG: PQQ-binding-like beta-propeller repeat protein [Planctomycetes bacterium]|nr:PQQ-binding-like beta-propeller repeat protein [Planctomycetota bacterium]